MIIRAVIVDDEVLARRGLRTLLSRVPDVEIVGECSKAGEAITLIQSQQPDLVFLDIQMSDHSGFDVMEAIGPQDCPCVVFVTAHDNFAIRAFDVRAFDYLLKPLDERRFGETLQRVRNALGGSRDRMGARGLSRLAVDRSGSAVQAAHGAADRIPVRSGGRVVVIRIADVDWVKAVQNYVALFVGEKSWLVKESISALEARFAPAGFIRIHRSTLVNVDRVKELRLHDRGEYEVVLSTGTALKLSRSYRAALPQLVGFVV